ncbi:uncharacterized protein LOC124410396 [Diprion similis]|uniref:uncharacterized protein LOC124410396 n=1 Tax=Diprion similis TaxID=362088 RepID=UPI001EF8DCF0|nr:uncharacterized protein LOC124410396 [Diprion similis]
MHISCTSKSMRISEGCPCICLCCCGMMMMMMMMMMMAMVVVVVVVVVATAASAMETVSAKVEGDSSPRGPPGSVYKRGLASSALIHRVFHHAQVEGNEKKKKKKKKKEKKKITRKEHSTVTRETLEVPVAEVKNTYQSK